MATPYTVQAEDGVLVPGTGGQLSTSVASSNGGAVGGAYMDLGSYDREGFKVTIPQDSAGPCDLTIRYALGVNQTRPLMLNVNGEDQGLVVFTTTGLWSTWEDIGVTATLAAGDNEVALLIPTGAQGGVGQGPNVDQITALQQLPTLAPRPYGAGAYGRAPYEYYGYVNAAARGASQVVSANVPFFQVVVLGNIIMAGRSASGPAWLPFWITRQVGLEGSAVDSGTLSAAVERGMALRGAGVSEGTVAALVTLGLSLFGQAVVGAEAYVYNVKSHRELRGAGFSSFIGSKSVERDMAAIGGSEASSVAVLSPLWNCGTVKAAEWSCDISAGATWEDVTVGQSSWEGRR